MFCRVVMCVLDPCFGRTRASTCQVEGSLLGLRSHGVGARAYDVVCVDTDRQVVGNLARTPGVRLPGVLQCRVLVLQRRAGTRPGAGPRAPRAARQALRELRRRDDRGC